jgi:hypothetical protein
MELFLAYTPQLGTDCGFLVTETVVFPDSICMPVIASEAWQSRKAE